MSIAYAVPVIGLIEKCQDNWACMSSTAGFNIKKWHDTTYFGENSQIFYTMNTV